LDKKTTLQLLLYGRGMNELKQPQAKQVLPIVSIVTFLGFLDTHLLIPVIALYASELKASPLFVGLIGDTLSMFLYSLSRLPVHLALVLGMVLRAKEHI